MINKLVTPAVTELPDGLKEAFKQFREEKQKQIPPGADTIRKVSMTQELAAHMKSDAAIALNLKVQDSILDTIESIRAQYIDQAKKDPQAAYEMAINTVDQLLEKIPEKHKKQISCKRGCSGCCHINVDIHQAEAALIGRYCKAHDISIDKAYLLKQLATGWKEIPLSDHSACVFLKEGQCSIYQVRPIACRKYLVASDPKYCDVKKFGPANNMVAVMSSIDVEIFMSAISGVGDHDKLYGRMPKMLLPYAD